MQLKGRDNIEILKTVKGKWRVLWENKRKRQTKKSYKKFQMSKSKLRKHRESNRVVVNKYKKAKKT